MTMDTLPLTSPSAGGLPTFASTLCSAGVLACNAFFSGIAFTEPSLDSAQQEIRLPSATDQLCLRSAGVSPAFPPSQSLLYLPWSCAFSLPDPLFPAHHERTRQHRRPRLQREDYPNLQSPAIPLKLFDPARLVNCFPGAATHEGIHPQPPVYPCSLTPQRLSYVLNWFEPTPAGQNAK
jgi:hypothetical protein